jgi:hypothetical protein
MTRRMSKHETACLEAMRNAPWATEALTVDLGAEVLIAHGMDRKDAERAAQRLYDKHLKIYGGAG